MTGSILKLLVEAEGFLSGEDMSRILGVSRTAIWKHIKKLKEQGYNIESVTNKGYMLHLEPDQYDAYEFKRILKNRNLFDKYFVYDTIDSTNKEAKRKAIEENIQSALLISEEQSVGVGRRGRQWVSKKGMGIYMSMLLKPTIKPINASMLTLLAGMAVRNGIREITGLECQIKWPNDLVSKGKKICGVLTEMSSEIDFINYVVVGIGINVNNEEFDQGIAELATSIKIETGIPYNRKDLIVQIVKEFEQYYLEFLNQESLEFMIKDYNKACVNIGKMVKVEINREIIIGKGIEITNNGSLKICLEDGTNYIVNSGEVSVRGLYGYI